MIRIGILGSGFGQEHARLLQLHDDVEVAGIFGRNTERLKAIEDEFGIRGVTDSDALFTDPSIDVIDVCVPTEFHYEYVMKALQHRKHVFCEMPISASLQEAEAMMAEAARVERHLLVNQFSKFFPAYQHIRQFLHGGHAGKVMAATQRIMTPLSSNDGPGLGRQTISVNLMTVEFDVTTWLFGVPKAVSAVGTAGLPSNRAEVQAFLAYEDLEVVVSASSMMPVMYPFTRNTIVHGEKGTLEFTFRIQGERLDHACLFYPVAGEAQDLGITHCYPHQAALNHMVEVIMGKAQDSPLSIQQAIASLRVAVAVNHALEQNYPTVDLSSSV